MHLSVNRVPGKVRSSLRKGSVTVTTTVTVTGFTDVSRLDDSTLFIYLGASVSSGGLTDTDQGIATFADVIGGDMPDWPGTEFDALANFDDTGLLTRFIGAT